MFNSYNHPQYLIYVPLNAQNKGRKKRLPYVALCLNIRPHMSKIIQDLTLLLNFVSSLLIIKYSNYFTNIVIIESIDYSNDKIDDYIKIGAISDGYIFTEKC